MGAHMSSTTKNVMFWMVAALVIFLFWSVSSRIQNNERSLSFSDFLAQLERGHVAKVVLTETGSGTEIVGRFKNGQSIKSFAPPQVDNLLTLMLDQGVEVTARDANRSTWLGHLISWTPIVLMIAFLIFFMRQMQGSTGSENPHLRLRQLQERRLEMKSRLLRILAESSTPLEEHELLDRLVDGPITRDDWREAGKGLYQMLSDGVVRLTADKRYELATSPRDG